MATVQIPKPALFEWMGYEIFSEDVKRFHESRARTLIPHAPARTSKSYSAFAEMAWRAFPEFERTASGLKPLRSKLIWAVGPTYETNKEFDYLYETLVENRSKIGFDYHVSRAANNPKQGNMVIVIEWGRSPSGDLCRTIIEGKSSTNEKALQGEEVDVTCLSEAAEHPPHILPKYIATRSACTILPTTPKPHADWLLELIEDGERDPEISTEGIHYRVEWSEDPTKRICPNPDYDWDRFEIEMRKAASRTDSGNAEDDPYFAEQFLGMWVYYTGKVLPFRHQAGLGGKMSHILPALPAACADARHFFSVDYGYDHKAAALFFYVLADGTHVIGHELVKKGLEPTEFIEQIQTIAAANGIDPHQNVDDPSRPEVGKIMRERGLDVWSGNKNALRDRAAGTLQLIDMLSDDPDLGRPKLFVTADCPETIECFKKLRRKEGHHGDEFAKSALDPTCEDDPFDAARYGVQSRVLPFSQQRERHWIYEYQAQQRVNRRATPQRFNPMIGPNPNLTREVRRASYV